MRSLLLPLLVLWAPRLPGTLAEVSAWLPSPRFGSQLAARGAAPPGDPRLRVPLSGRAAAPHQRRSPSRAALPPLPLAPGTLGHCWDRSVSLLPWLRGSSGSARAAVSRDPQPLPSPLPKAPRSVGSRNESACKAEVKKCQEDAGSAVACCRTGSGQETFPLTWGELTPVQSQAHPAGSRL